MQYLVIIKGKSTVGRNGTLVVFPSEDSRSKWTPGSETNTIGGIQREVFRFNLFKIKVSLSNNQ